MAADLLAHLSALQFADSAFPSGRYTLSHGLEPLAQNGLLAGGNRQVTLHGLLEDNLRLSVGPADGTAVACAHSSYQQQDLVSVTAVERRLTAVKLTAEARHASIRTGKALLGTAHTFIADPMLDKYAAMVRDGSVPGHHAVVIGLLGASVGLSALESVAGELLPLLGEESLFQATLRRIAPLVDPADTYVVAEQRHLPLVQEQAPQLAAANLLGEPVGRNTAASTVSSLTNGSSGRSRTPSR